MTRGMCSAALLLALLAPGAMASSLRAQSLSSALSADLSENLKERPVAKIVRMLKDMESELRSELEDDKAVQEMLSCWCETNEKEKTKAIELGQAKISALEASIGEAAATMRELKEKRKATQEEQYADEKALGEATALRMKENKAFQTHETDLLEAVDAAKQAVIALSKHHGAELSQVKAVAERLTKAQVPKLLQKVHVKLEKAQLDALQAFIKEAQAGKSNFMQMQIPGMKSYAPQSGQIFGILKQMKADFEDDLSAAQKAEAKAVKEFEELRTAKEQEIATAKKMIIEIDQQLGSLMEKHAEDSKALEETEEQLGLDQTFLANLQKKCSMSDEEFEKRVKDRLTEIAAVEDTIKILNSDEAFDVFDKTVSNDGTVKKVDVIAATSFLQTISATHEEQQRRREQVAQLLQTAASRYGAVALALLASKAKLDDFTKVKEAIDKMVAELKVQQADEVKHRDWCTDEFNTNAADMAKAEDKKSSLETKIADLESSIKRLTEDIASSQAAMKEAQVQMKRRSEAREAENAENQQTITDQRLTQMILEKALARMQQVYLFMQKPGAPHTQTSATHTDPGNGPASFKKYEENSGGKRVVMLLQDVLNDSQKVEDETMAAEKDGQEAYEDFMKESNTMIKATTKSVMSMTEAKARDSEDLAMSKTDLKETFANMEALDTYKGDLHKNCDFTMKNFDARQAARAAEIEALGEAKAILSGMQ